MGRHYADCERVEARAAPELPAADDKQHLPVARPRLESTLGSAKMYGFRPSAKWVCAASAVMIFAAFAAGTAWGQRDAGLAAQALANWLESEDGDHDELQAVTQHGQAIVPSLIAALNQGP